MGPIRARRGEAQRIAYTDRETCFANSLSALGKAYAASERDEDDVDDNNPTSGQTQEV